MSAWIIYSKDGRAKCETRQLTYSGEYMGACSVSVNIFSPTPIGFELGDWMEYRGERFELNYDPSVVKEASSGGYGEGFRYENVVFNSLSDELTRCAFLDYVADDNGLHYFSLPTFSFFADTIEKLAERIQVNLDRVYKGDKKWTVEVHKEYVNTLNVNVSANNNTVWDALGFVNSLFDANFIIRGRKITIGTSGMAVGSLFSYGKGNGLFSIEKSSDSSQQVITRLRAYGSTRNMPSDYYQRLGEGVPNNMAVKNLMLPSFPAETHDPYLDSKNVEQLGVREGAVFFDGSNELEEIYPSMEGMTAEELKAAGIEVNATGALDVVVSAEQIADNGKVPEDGKGEQLQPTFKVNLKDVGFDLNDYLSAEGGATLSMKDGMCGGREFEIVKCVKVQGGYELTCNRAYDDGLELYFPYKDYPIKSGDTFVLLNIEMPEVYVQAASQRLLKAAEAYLAKNDYVRYTYIPTVDNLFLARQHDEAVKNGEKSIYDTIKEGDLMLFEDDDLGIANGSVTIASLNIKEDLESSLIPEYEITLQDKKSVGTISKIQNQIANLAAHGGSGGSVNTEQVQSIVEALGRRLFLSKTRDDRSRGMIASDKGVEVGVFNEGTLGSGAAIIMRDGSSYGEVDFLKVRKKATFTNITIQELKHVGGEIVLSPAAMVCSKVEKLADGWKCYFNAEDSDGRKAYNEFEVGDQARCQTFNLERNIYYWRLVTSVGDDFIVLSKSDCDANSDTPLEGDNISQLGNRNNKERQAAIILSAYGSDAPSYKQYNGINSYSLDGKQVTKLSPYGNELTGVLNIEKGSKGWDNLEGLPSSIQNAVDLANKAQETIDNTSVGAVNLLRNSGFTGDYQSEDMIAADQLDSGSELFSKKLDKWDGDAVVYTDANAMSECSAQLGGLSQSVKELIAGESYVVSFKARGSVVNVSCGDFSVEQTLTSGYAKYSFKFEFSGSKVFTIEGNARICDLQLERGTIATDWNASPYDNDKAFAEFQSLKYLQDAIANGNTTVLGGLILSSILKLGNYKEGKMQKVNAGVSGIYNDENDVAFWAGGTFEEAIKTVMKFKSNPMYRPTEEEWRSLANFAVSHGGDIFLRGYIYALGGFFRGAVEIAEGKIMLNADGSGSLASEAIKWDDAGIMYRKATDVIVWVRPDGSTIDYKKGTYIDLSTQIYGGGGTITLPTPPADKYRICISLKKFVGTDSHKLLGNFFIYNAEEEMYVPSYILSIYRWSQGEFWLTYHEGKGWYVETSEYTITEDSTILGKRLNYVIGEDVESRTEIKEDKIKVKQIELTDTTDESLKTKGGAKIEKEVLVGTDKGSDTWMDKEKVKTKSVEAKNEMLVGSSKDSNTYITPNKVRTAESETTGKSKANSLEVTGSDDNSISTNGGVQAKKISLSGSIGKSLFLASPTDTSGAPMFRGIADDDIDGLKGLKSDVSTLKDDVSTLKTDVNTLKTNVGTLQTTTGTLRTDLNGANAEINTLKESVTKITSAIEKIEERVKALEDAASDTGGES